MSTTSWRRDPTGRREQGVRLAVAVVLLAGVIAAANGAGEADVAGPGSGRRLVTPADVSSSGTVAVGADESDAASSSASGEPGSVPDPQLGPTSATTQRGGAGAGPANPETSRRITVEPDAHGVTDD